MLRAAVYSEHRTYAEYLMLGLQAKAGTASVASFAQYSDLTVIQESHAKLNFDILIIDMELNGGDCIPWLEELQQQLDAPAVILVTRHAENILKAYPLHPLDVILLPCDGSRFVDAIRSAAKWNAAFRETVSKIVIDCIDGEKIIPLENILYIEYSHKRMIFHIDDHSILTSKTIRVPLEEALSELMRDKRFVRVHSAYIVNVSYAIELSNMSFRMQDGKEIPVSRKRYSDIRKRFQSVIVRHSPRTANINAALHFCKAHAQQLEYLRQMPMPYCIIRVDVNLKNEPYDFVFMFVNPELCKLEGKSEDELLGASFYDVFVKADKKWLAKYWASAYNGDKQQFDSYSPEIGKQLRISCYQPTYGYCGCILQELRDDKLIPLHANV